MFVVRYAIPQKAILYQNKYTYNLEWNHLEETVKFRGFLYEKTMRFVHI
jgi:hypothetical protein